MFASFLQLPVDCERVPGSLEKRSEKQIAKAFLLAADGRG
jgi:hypothetical protein